MSMFDNLDFTKQEKSEDKLKAMGYEQFGRERCPTGSIFYRKGNDAKKVNYDGSIENMDYNFDVYDKDVKDFENLMSKIAQKTPQRRNVGSPPFGSDEVVFTTGNSETPNYMRKTLALIAIGTGLYFLLKK